MSPLTSRMHRKMHEHVPDELDPIPLSAIRTSVRAAQAWEAKRHPSWQTPVTSLIARAVDDIRHARQVAIESGDW